MSKRIFYISPGTELGGGEVSLITLIANLDRYEPVVCVYGEGAFAERMRQMGFKLYIESYSNPISQPAFITKLAWRIRQSRASLVHVNTLDIRAGIATRLTNRPLIGHLRVIFPTTWVDRLFVKLSSCTISVSNAARNYLCQTQHLSPDHFETIYNAVDVKLTSPSPVSIRQELGLSSHAQLIGVVGRIDPWKGMETFIEAASLLTSKYPNLHFAIAGSPGPLPEEQAYLQVLRKKVAELNLDHLCHFLGYRSDALGFICQLDGLIVPSRELFTPSGIKTEGFGRVAAEGLAMKTPVIASRIGGLPEIIQHGKTGYLFEPANPQSLAETICQVLDHPVQTQAVVEEGYRHFQQAFSVATHLNNIQGLYDRILAQ